MNAISVKKAVSILAFILIPGLVAAEQTWAKEAFRCLKGKCLNLGLEGGNGSYPSKEVFAKCYLELLSCLKSSKKEGLTVPAMKREFNHFMEPFMSHYHAALGNLQSNDFDVNSIARVNKRLKLCHDLKVATFQRSSGILGDSKDHFDEELRKLDEDFALKVDFLLKNRKTKLERISSSR